jgi:hypothetical protein
MKLTVENYIPNANEVIIKPKRTITVVKKVQEWDEEANANHDPQTEDLQVKEVKKRVDANCQLAEVICVNPNSEFKVGDVIVYTNNSSADFDLIKGSKVIKSFDIKGKVLNEQL